METKYVQHTYCRNEIIISSAGTIIVDENGVVTNIEALGVTIERILQVPGFFPTDLAPTSIVPKEMASKPVAPLPSLAGTETIVRTPDRDYIEVLKHLAEIGAARNSEGYVEMNVLLDELKAKGLAPISGSRRKALEDMLRGKAAPEAKPESKRF